MQCLYVDISNMSDKFQSFNHVFIASTESINYLNLQNYLLPRISRGANTFPRGTIFYLLCGIHHHPSAKYDGKPGPSDPSLNISFHYALFRSLSNFCGYLECKNCDDFFTKPCDSNLSVWKDMEYSDRIIPLYTIPESNNEESEEEEESYELSNKSKIDLENLSRDLLNQTKPTALIFASCYSLYSNITELLRSNGIVAVLNLSRDLGEVTEGKLFCLDNQQRNVIHHMSNVCIYSYP